MALCHHFKSNESAMGIEFKRFCYSFELFKLLSGNFEEFY